MGRRMEHVDRTMNSGALRSHVHVVVVDGRTVRTLYLCSWLLV